MRRSGPLVGLLFVAIGVLLLLDALDVIAVLRWRIILPLVLVALGAWMLAAGRRSSHGDTGEGSSDGSSDGNVDVLAVLGDRNLGLTTAYRGGSVVAVLADVEVDLRESPLEHSPASIDVTVVLGDVKILVPPHWHVRSSGPTLLSDVEVRPNPAHGSGDGPPPELVVRTSGLFGDIKVR